jgi:membrane protein
MPNTKVRWGPGAIGGVLTGVLFVLWLWACAAMQVSVAGYSRLYGSFAVIPILLAWLFMSWQIVLFGAEVSFAMQNHATYRMESGARRASAEARVAMALAVVLDAARGFTQGGGPFESARFAREQGVSVRFLNEVVDELAQAGILAAVSGGDGGRYALLRAPDALPAREVAAVMLRTGATPASLGLTRLAPPVARLMAQFAGAVGGETVGDLLKDGAA